MTLPEQPGQYTSPLDSFEESPMEPGVLRAKHVGPRTLPPPDAPMDVISHLAAELQDIYRHYGQWMVWTGAQWEVADDEQIEKRLNDATADAFYHKVTAMTEQKRPWAPTGPKIRNLVHALKAERRLDTRVRPGDWLNGHAKRGEYIACRNGLVRLADKTLHDSTRMFFNTVASPFEYTETGPEPERWLAFLRSVWPDEVGPGGVPVPATEIRTLKQWFGYVLSGRTEQQKALALIGPRRSGKGTIFNTLTQLIGRGNTAAFTLSGLSSDFGLANLVGKSLAIAADVRWSKKVDNGEVVGNLLSAIGRDTMPVRRKYKDTFETQIDARFMIGSNESLPFHDDSAAVASRFITLRMRQTFLGREDFGLADAVEAELPAILRWALDGLADLDREGRFTLSEQSQREAEASEESASPALGFLHDCCEVTGDESDFVAREEVRQAWAAWCMLNGVGVNWSLIKLIKAIEAADSRCRSGQRKAHDGLPYARGMRGFRLHKQTGPLSAAHIGQLFGPAVSPN